VPGLRLAGLGLKHDRRDVADPPARFAARTSGPPHPRAPCAMSKIAVIGSR
jgi:hypothetical protein